jgi:hypothetical protein
MVIEAGILTYGDTRHAPTVAAQCWTWTSFHPSALASEPLSAAMLRAGSPRPM